MRHDGFDADELARRLAARDRRHLDDPGLRTSAVLMPLFWKGDRLHTLFTKRSEEVSSHKGQYSFPGGHRDPGDPTLEATALRECEEEIGVGAGSIRVLGPLDDLKTIWGVRITPYLAMIEPPGAYRLQAREVVSVLETPLSPFLDPPRIERRHDGDHVREVYFYDVDGEVVWGATARIVKECLDMMGAELGRSPSELKALFGS